MTAVSSELRIDVLDSFAALQTCIQLLNSAVLQDEGLSAWMQEAPELLNYHPLEKSHRAQACCVINQLEYAPDQEPREILVCSGFIGCSEKTLQLAKDLNLAKDKFKQTVLNLRHAKISLADIELNQKFQSDNYSRSDKTSKTLQKMGLSRLHLKQCYRKIPILSHPPLKISWTWAHTRSIKRVSVQQAQSMLLKKSQDTGIQNQLNILSTLPHTEPLAIVQELAPHLRANILFSNELAPAHRRMVKGPVPIFFPANLTTPSPLFKPPGEKAKKDENRLIRNDVRLDPNPFLPAIRAHRYKMEVETRAKIETETES